jgi:hypothetical protein
LKPIGYCASIAAVIAPRIHSDTVFRLAFAADSIRFRSSKSLPNVDPPISYMTSPLLGQSTQMLGASLGSGGQNRGLNPCIKSAARDRCNWL